MSDDGRTRQQANQQANLREATLSDNIDNSNVSCIQGDQTFYQKFSCGAVSIPWQEEIIETGVFQVPIDCGTGSRAAVGPAKPKKRKKKLLGACDKNGLS